MLTIGNIWQIVTQDSPTISVGTILYLQKKAIGEPIGLLLSITSSGAVQKCLKTNSGLMPILS